MYKKQENEKSQQSFIYSLSISFSDKTIFSARSNKMNHKSKKLHYLRLKNDVKKVGKIEISKVIKML